MLTFPASCFPTCFHTCSSFLIVSELMSFLLFFSVLMRRSYKKNHVAKYKMHISNVPFNNANIEWKMSVMVSITCLNYFYYISFPFWWICFCYSALFETETPLTLFYPYPVSIYLFSENHFISLCLLTEQSNPVFADNLHMHAHKNRLLFWVKNCLTFGNNTDGK